MKIPTIGFIVGVALVGAWAESANSQDEKALRARGEYLVDGPAACGNCHTQRGTDLFADPNKYLAGGYKFDIPPGLAFSKNITPDNDTGIGSWTDRDPRRRYARG